MIHRQTNNSLADNRTARHADNRADRTDTQMNRQSTFRQIERHTDKPTRSKTDKQARR